MPSVTFPIAGRLRSGRSESAFSVGARLAVRRMHCGLSISALADATGLSEEALALAEGGCLDLGESDYGAVARVLGLPAEDLLRPVQPASNSERSLELALARRIASIRDDTVRRALIDLVTTVAAAGELSGGGGEDPDPVAERRRPSRKPHRTR